MIVRDKVVAMEVLGTTKIREVLRTGTYASFYLEPLPSNKQLEKMVLRIPESGHTGLKYHEHQD
jgi:hypothetical protein